MQIVQKYFYKLLLKSIKKLSPETTFFGVGGPMMVQEGLKTENNYGDPSKFLDKPFFATMK